MRRLLLAVVPMFVLLLAAGTAAQDATTVMTRDDPALGTILTDASGKTLYMFTKDTPNTSNCYDKCAENWPIFTASEPLTLPDGVEGTLGLITRTDGTTQVTYNEMPLYYFAKDQNPGDTTGQEVGDVWYVVNPGDTFATHQAEEATPAASPMAGTTVMVVEDPALGPILTDAAGMTLYLFTVDTVKGESACYDQCEENWPVFTASEPLTLPEGVEGTLGTIERTDGVKQVTYNDIPLYYWAKDEKPGDTTGQGVGDVWYVVTPGQQFGEPVMSATPAAA
jgi:predicted lipoprotein with Yx(FWY)xxD motif